jgi:hypothetical protein
MFCLANSQMVTPRLACGGVHSDIFAALVNSGTAQLEQAYHVSHSICFEDREMADPPSRRDSFNIGRPTPMTGVRSASVFGAFGELRSATPQTGFPEGLTANGSRGDFRHVR